jgi:Zn-dependent protease with chaperone function
MSSIPSTGSFRVHPLPSAAALPDAAENDEIDTDAISTLYRAQAVANQVVKSTIFPCYTPEYIQAQAGFKKGALVCYAKVYDGVCAIGRCLEKLILQIQKAISKILAMNDHALEKALQSLKNKIRPVLDAVYPINPINGHRRFVGVPRSVEKFLGDRVFYPLASAGMQKSSEYLVDGDSESIAKKVKNVLNTLKNANAELLNPSQEKTQFKYRVKTVISKEMNAFAVPAGGMVVFSQLIKEIDAALKAGKYKQSTIEFADGSRATVDLTGLELDEVIAALLGHEMTHVASRHSFMALIARVVRSILIDIGRYFSVAYLKSKDKEYQALKTKPLLTQREVQVLLDKEYSYDRINGIFSKIGDGIKHICDALLSRANEYEADATGTWFAQKAGFNPLGAIYLQEVLKDSETGITSYLHENFEFLFSHPHGAMRKRALFAVINEIAPDWLNGRVKWDINTSSKYNINESNEAVKYASKTANRVAAPVIEEVD